MSAISPVSASQILRASNALHLSHSKQLSHSPSTKLNFKPFAPSANTGSRKCTTIFATSLRDQAQALSNISESEGDAFVNCLASDLLSATGSGNSSVSEPLKTLKRESVELVQEMRWPSNRDEEFRFTDLKPLKSSNRIEPRIAPFISKSDFSDMSTVLERLKLKEAENSTFVFWDGVLQKDLSSVHTNFGDGVVLGNLQDLDKNAVQRFVEPNLGAPNLSATSSLDLFTCLNSIGCLEPFVIAIPKFVKFASPIHIIHLSTPSSATPSAHADETSKISTSTNIVSPRVLVVVEEGGSVELIEEYASCGGGNAWQVKRNREGSAASSVTWMNSVVEIFIEKNAKVDHSIVQTSIADAVLTKRTFVAQSEGSSYRLVEAELGCQLSRHNFLMLQTGQETETEVSTFSLCGRHQCQDLHSSLVLDHPRGQTRQLHKCIVSDGTGTGVFDGNVKVNRLAQQTDAQQLSRSLLLSPRGTVNVKPNLQIIADDVKCTHGAAISDLEDEQMFYLRSRGISEQAARSALVFSFGAEVIEKLKYLKLRTRVEECVKSALLAQGAMDIKVADSLQTL